MNFSFPQPLLEAYRAKKLAICVGSGLSLSEGVQGNFPTWKELPQRLLDACARYGVADSNFIQSQTQLFKTHMGLEQMLSMLGILRTTLGRDYQKALNDIFRPKNARPGTVHHAIAQLGIRALLTTNFDPLIEDVRESPRRLVYTWKESSDALHDLESERPVLLKIHGTAERADTVIITELEYHQARASQSYQAVLSHLFQGFTFLFLGYGMNDPLDIDLVLKWNAESFRSVARRHYALMKQPSDNEPRAPEWDRYLREYNVQVLGYRNHGDIPALVESVGGSETRTSPEAKSEDLSGSPQEGLTTTARFPPAQSPWSSSSASTIPDRQLVEIFAELYPSPQQARVIWQRAGGHAGEIPYSIEQPRDMWWSLWRQSLLGGPARPTVLLREALKDVPNNFILREALSHLNGE
jgi:hypothetical protein